MNAFREAQAILDESRAQVLGLKEVEGWEFAWKRDWVETPQGDQMFMEVLALDWNVIYTFGPFVNENGLTWDEVFITDNYQEAVKAFALAALAE